MVQFLFNNETDITIRKGDDTTDTVISFAPGKKTYCHISTLGLTEDMFEYIEADRFGIKIILEEDDSKLILTSNGLLVNVHKGLASLVGTPVGLPLADCIITNDKGELEYPNKTTLSTKQVIEVAELTSNYNQTSYKTISQLEEAQGYGEHLLDYIYPQVTDSVYLPNYPRVSKEFLIATNYNQETPFYFDGIIPKVILGDKTRIVNLSKDNPLEPLANYQMITKTFNYIDANDKGFKVLATNEIGMQIVLTISGSITMYINGKPIMEGLPSNDVLASPVYFNSTGDLVIPKDSNWTRRELLMHSLMTYALSFNSGLDDLIEATNIVNCTVKGPKTI